MSGTHAESALTDAIEFRSRLPGVAWPAVPDERGMTTLALQYQFERTERWPRERLRDLQFQQLDALLRHAAEQVPYYADVLARAGFRPGSPLTEEIWRRIPILRRVDVQRAPERLRAQTVPAFHGALLEASSSGSTGRPVTVLTTEFCGMLFDAMALREALWHRRNLGGTLAVMRSLPSEMPEDGKRAVTWNRAIGSTVVGGPSVLFECSRPAPNLARALARLDPDYMFLYPSLLAELAREAERQGLRFPALAGLNTFGEQLSDDVRALAEAQFKVPLADVYGAEETGFLALQCPEDTVYHVPAETVLLEVLDDEGAECAPGQAGRVVVTPLHNFATPLLRYEIGDFAEPGPPCRCGRGLPVLRRILGRGRNMLLAADGTKFWPRLAGLNDSSLPITQYQLVQHATDRFELRIVATRPLDASEEERLRRLLAKLCRGNYAFAFTYHAEISRGPAGKYEDFTCAIPATTGAEARA